MKWAVINFSNFRRWFLSSQISHGSKIKSGWKGLGMRLSRLGGWSWLVSESTSQSGGPRLIHSTKLPVNNRSISVVELVTEESSCCHWEQFLLFMWSFQHTHLRFVSLLPLPSSSPARGFLVVSAKKMTKLNNKNIMHFSTNHSISNSDANSIKSR